MIIFAVDPGVKNMGYACYDTERRTFLTFGKFDMLENVRSVEKTKYAFLARRFCESMKVLLDRCDVLVIEAQMQAKMKVIQTAIQCFYWSKSVVVGPLAVRNFFGISMSNYRLNKKTSIELAPFLIRTKAENTLMNSFKKKDDVADAIILARYWDIKERGDTWAKPAVVLVPKKRKRSVSKTTKRKKKKAPTHI